MSKRIANRTNAIDNNGRAQPQYTCDPIMKMKMRKQLLYIAATRFDNKKQITSTDCLIEVEKLSGWDFLPHLELEDLVEVPEARIGTGEGEV